MGIVFARQQKTMAAVRGLPTAPSPVRFVAGVCPIKRQLTRGFIFVWIRRPLSAALGSTASPIASPEQEAVAYLGTDSAIWSAI